MAFVPPDGLNPFPLMWISDSSSSGPWKMKSNPRKGAAYIIDGKHPQHFATQVCL